MSQSYLNMVLKWQEFHLKKNESHPDFAKFQIFCKTKNIYISMKYIHHSQMAFTSLTDSSIERLYYSREFTYL